MSEIVVYLGPTMPVAQAREILPDAIYRPPAAQSDIISAVDSHRPAAIAVIDGVFTQALSVWHKEILYALERGVAVLGSSSMGALRVAETAAFGAVGVGGIYDAYASGELTDDDEVAVMHATAEEGYRCLSDAMVNIRATLAAARDAGVVDEQQHDLLIAAAKSRFFPERTYAALLADGAASGLPVQVLEGLREFIRAYGVDAKRDDAVALLRRLAAGDFSSPDPVAVTRSHPFAAMYQRDRRIERRGMAVPLADISSYAALHLTDFPAVNEHALHSGLADVLGEMLHVEPDADALAAELHRFRADRRLRGDDDLARWQRDNDLNDADFDELIRRLAVRRALRDWYVSRKYLERTTQEVLDELRLQGRYPAVADAAAHQQAVLAQSFPDFGATGDDSSLVDLVREQSRSTRWRPTVALEQWAFENGFKDVYDVRFELVRAKRARQAMAAAAESLAGLLTGDAGGESGGESGGRAATGGAAAGEPSQSQ